MPSTGLSQKINSHPIHLQFARERGWTVEQTIRALIDANPAIAEDNLEEEDETAIPSPAEQYYLVEAYPADMADVETIPPPPADWKGDSDANPSFRALSSLSPPVNRKIEPYGAAFLAYVRRKILIPLSQRCD